MNTIVTVTSETTRADLAKTLRFQNIEAQKLSRRGYTGTRSHEYEIVHDRLNALIDDYWAARA